MIKDSNIYNIIGKHLAKEITDKETLIFDEWLNRSDENLKEFELHKKIWEETEIRYNTQSSDHVFRDILNKIDDEHEIDLAPAAKWSNRRIIVNIGLISKIAATLLIIVTFSYLINNHYQKSLIDNSVITMFEKQNPSGQKLKIFLPDGSEVWLNAESKISYPEKFSDSTREVTLEGEAFFSVIKNPDKPFIVSAGNVTTTVLGTSFNVHAYNNEPEVYIALQSGKVKVDISKENGSEELYLEPGEGISYDKTGDKTIKEEFDQDLLLGWKDGKIVFKGAGLNEIIGTLSRWYGVEFKVENRKNEDWEYTGFFNNENLENVLNSISFSKDFTYTIDQKQVIIHLN